MPKPVHKHILWALMVSALVLGLWTITISSSFQLCEKNQQATSTQQTQKHPPEFIFTVANHAAIYWRCGLHVIYDYRDAVTAIATVFIALFTFTLWQSTSGLVAAAATQSKDMQAAIEASNRSAVAADKAAQAAITSNQIAVTNAEQQLRAYVTARDINLVTHRHPPRMGAHGPIEGQIHTYGLAAILKNRRPQLTSSSTSAVRNSPKTSLRVLSLRTPLCLDMD
jgi:hypothetical protein